jgi:hypothetical protein
MPPLPDWLFRDLPPSQPLIRTFPPRFPVLWPFLEEVIQANLRDMSDLFRATPIHLQAEFVAMWGRYMEREQVPNVQEVIEMRFAEGEMYKTEYHLYTSLIKIYLWELKDFEEDAPDGWINPMERPFDCDPAASA